MHQRTRTRRSTQLCAALVALGIGLGAAGCTSDKDAKALPTPAVTSAAPSPMPSPSVDPIEEAKQVQMEAGKAAYVELIRLQNEVAQAGGGEEQWQKIAPGIATDTRAAMHEYYVQMAAEGSHQTGDVTVDVEVTGYAGDPLDAATTQEVTLDACVDPTGATIVNPDGESALSMAKGRSLSRIVMRTQQDGRWTMVDSERIDAC